MPFTRNKEWERKIKKCNGNMGKKENGKKDGKDEKKNEEEKERER